ncbi:sce7726 family protein [uncultured Gardnerella sp.]|uniref:sce7726 family protein n=1 Tax=uncultured Gardnerella sp. TaxID=293424 RepID=UPI00261F169C|nr:sce7726 family protein [uncultured Gardnerella sp.]
MTGSNIILNHLFTKNVFSDDSIYENKIYKRVASRFVDNPEDKNNGMIISEIYKFMSKSYRNEYFYQNTLLNKLLLGKYSMNTATALTQISIGKSKADFILINGKAVVYEIKTELDTFDRLEHQLDDYFKAFDHVCVVTSEGKYNHAIEILENTPVGIYVLTKQNTISEKLRKEPIKDNSKLEHTAIFKVLRKREYENILEEYFHELPNVKQVFYYDECLSLFKKIPICDAYRMMLKQLKIRNKIENISVFDDIPYELKSLMYFSSMSKYDWAKIDRFLNKKYGG